ncbi:pentatricopeptide repeat-containing protein, chloroplastic-like protein [Cinnamomum micranthum f. kanehirae]|uniref:Pentatricopeptide repeat-containing protein, chloroplastic-like protein n=1 Tax=Cinnamomum micranthum f. kanehirae TaxID=337451 RepID=A0A3S4PLB2_9MAGN|nr:pentatricopeptide repeat-containing protein, chloroplastic-like protein [Cinnamomum micranthum f. kanehirae]
MNAHILAVHHVSPSPSPDHEIQRSTRSWAHSLSTSISSCSSMAHILQIHGRAIKLGRAEDSFLWNTMIRSLARTQAPEQALHLFDEMLQRASVPPDKFTFPFALSACARLRALDEGSQLHSLALRSGLASDPVLQNALIHMYAQSGCLHSAQQVFDRNPKRDVVSWNSLIGGYLKQERVDEASRLFSAMPHQRTAFSWNVMISGCTRAGRPELALSLIRHLDPAFNWSDSAIPLTSLIKMYAESGEVDAARQVFDCIRDRDVVCWSAMISGYVRCGRHVEGLRLFRDMLRDAEMVKPDEVMMVCVASACAHLGALDQGRWVHAFIRKNMPSMRFEGELGCALIDMYSKCGSVEDALAVLNEMSVTDIMVWNSIICGLGINGRGKDALRYFEEMLESGIRPDGVTFVGILNACSHVGLLVEGQRCFHLMTSYAIEPDIKHYGCMIDLLGRAGLVDEATTLVRSMPMKPNVEIWGALLGACRRHGNVTIAEWAARNLIELDPDHSSCHVLLSNVYAAAGQWDKARDVRKMMRAKGVERVPGCSLIESKGNVYEFVVGDVSHPRAQEIYSKLKEMIERLKMTNHVSDTSQVLFDVEEEEKEAALGYHSEKLALALGLIDTSPRDTIRIVKNLRVCGDCHSAMKLVSLIYDRDIILRDRHRFHHFKEGSCSCVDYW